jgi:tetratricopeptide (TPR) repeat protein
MKKNKLFPVVEAISLFGEPLLQLPLLPDIYKKQKELFDVALKNYEKDPSNSDNLIWLGRRAAYLGRFRDAITIFSRGIKQFPNNARMYRHRGHRFITLRYFKLAIEDFLKASVLIKGTKDEIEPDGMPNPRGIPVSSLHSNIWYHLGLAFFLEGQYELALNAYEKCIKVSKLADNYVSTGHWMYMTLKLLDRDKEANKLLEKVTNDMDIIENQHYYNCMLMYKGESKPEVLLLKAQQAGGITLATIGYGIAKWYLINKQKEDAIFVLKEIISLDNWASFGYIAAEAELKRLLF